MTFCHRKINTLILLLGIYSLACYGQGNTTPGNGRSEGLAGCRATIGNPLLNPAAVSGGKRAEVMISACNLYSVRELNNSAASFTLWDTKRTLTFSVSGNGIPGFMRYGITLIAGKQFTEKFSAGVSLDYLRISFAGEYPACHQAGFTAGILLRAGENLWIGTVFKNPVLAILAARWVQPYSSYIAGLRYAPVPNVALYFEAEKNTHYPITVKLGAEAGFGDRFFARIGISRTLSFGWGWRWKDWTVDLAASYHRFLGFNSSVTMHYFFKGGG